MCKEEQYAQVTKMLGKRLQEAMCFHGTKNVMSKENGKKSFE